MSAAPAVVVDEAVIVMSRIFDAPRPLVWKAMTEPEHLVQWWGGHGFTNPVCEMDARPGGRWDQMDIGRALQRDRGRATRDQPVRGVIP